MGVFRNFPYSNFHEMNMDEIIKIIKNMLEEWAQYHAEWDAWMAQMNDDWSNYQEVMNDAWQNMQDFINNYFDNLDVQEEINNKIVSMIQTGEFGLLVNEYIPPAVNAWLNTNITEPEGVVIDTSLTVAGACADAKATGDAIREVANNLKTLNDLNITWILGTYIWKEGGVEVTGASYKCTDYIPLTEFRFPFVYKLRVFSNVATYALYDKNKNFIRSESTTSATLEWVEDEIQSVEENAAFIRFSTETQYDPASIYIKIGSIAKSHIVLGDENLIELSNIGETVITHDDMTNFVDLTKIKSGYYIDATGAEHSATGYNITDFIPLEDDKTYYERNILFTYFAFYDTDKNLIESYDTYGNFTEYWFVPPTGTAYGRFTINDTQLATGPWISIFDVKPSPYKVKINNANINCYAQPTGINVDNPCNYEGKEIDVFNKICCIGDSITIGTFNHNEGGTEQYLVDTKYSYPTYLTKMYGVNTENWGLGGNTSVQWWTAKQNENFSGFDCAIINLGINDALNSVPIADTETALRNIINALKTANNNIKIFLATIVPAYADGVTTFDSVNELIENLAEEITNCYLVNLTEYSHVSKGSVYEAGHLTALGYRMLAQDYACYIGYIIRTNMNDFKWVQFIGTNYSRS